MIGFGGGRLRRAVLAAGVAGLVVLAGGVAGASAFTEPGLKRTYSDFANCPVPTLGEEYGSCLHSFVTGGAVQIGHGVVPISVPGDTFDLGFRRNESECFGVTSLSFTECFVMSGQHGILNGPAQPVPGGLLGSVGNVQLTGVTAKVEWATPVPPETVFGIYSSFNSEPATTTYDSGNLLGAENTAVTLRAKFHLISPFLGANCYIGSASNPIVIPLTTGLTSPPPPNTPLRGSVEGNRENGEGTIIAFPNLRLVNNSFAVPVATGCGTTGGGLVDGAIDHKLGLPSSAGHNTILLDVEGEQAGIARLLEHGWTGE